MYMRFIYRTIGYSRCVYIYRGNDGSSFIGCRSRDTLFSMGCSNIDTFGLDSGHRFERDLSQRVGLHMGCAWVVGCGSR